MIQLRRQQRDGNENAPAEFARAYGESQTAEQETRRAQERIVALRREHPQAFGVWPDYASKSFLTQPRKARVVQENCNTFTALILTHEGVNNETRREGKRIVANARARRPAGSRD